MIRKQELIRVLIDKLKKKRFISEKEIKKYIDLPTNINPINNNEDPLFFKIGEVLVAINAIDSIPIIKEIIESCKDTSIVNRSIETLGFLKQPTLTDYFLELLNSKKYKKSYFRIIEALGKTGSSKAKAILLDLLNDEDYTIRYLAIDTLGDLRFKKAAPKILEILFVEENEIVRIHAIIALRKINAKSSIKKIVEYMDKKELNSLEEFHLAYTLARIEGKKLRGYRILKDKYLKSELNTNQNKLYIDLAEDFIQLTKKDDTKNKDKVDILGLEHQDSPKSVFVSYSWDSKDHKKWVLKLAEDLVENGVKVFLDQWYLDLGESTIEFMDYIEEADFVLVICTKGYLKKSKRRKSGVRYEISILKAKELRDLDRNTTIPIFRDSIDDAPIYLSIKMGLDMRNEENYKEEFQKLLRRIWDKKSLKPPKLGKPPKFDE